MARLSRATNEMTRICTAEGKHCDLGEKRAPGTPRRRARKGERCAHFLSASRAFRSSSRKKIAPFARGRSCSCAEDCCTHVFVGFCLPALGKFHKVCACSRIIRASAFVGSLAAKQTDTRANGPDPRFPQHPAGCVASASLRTAGHKTAPGRLRSLRFSPHRRAKSSTRPAAQPAARWLAH